MERTRIDHERSFPQISLPSPHGERPIEVILIAQLDPGAGDALAASAGRRQSLHPTHIDALDEPSALLSPPDFSRHDPTSLFSFSVGPQGHPFHRHAGRRVFTAISGSGGARLRFSTATLAEIETDPAAFLRALRHVEVPADCMFTVRFDGGTWHQFQPLRGDGRHPALFALSCHPDELGGLADGPVRKEAASGHATLAGLTEVLPAAVVARLAAAERATSPTPTTTLAFHAAPHSWQQRGCALIRSFAGRLRRRIARPSLLGFVAHRASMPSVRRLHELPIGSLLQNQLDVHHCLQDCVAVTLDSTCLRPRNPTATLAALLQAFVEHPPASVGGLMQLRNLLVRPLGLRTARLGCPVSSLASMDTPEWFLQRFPVLAQQHDANSAQVILGADDRHLCFRSCVAVRIEANGMIEVSLSTRVQCRNVFGHAYMAVVDPVHRHFVGPRLLSAALAELLLPHSVPAAAPAN